MLKIFKGNPIDLTGQRFGRLLVIEDALRRDTSHGIIWKCQCDCGNITSVRSASLRNSGTRSCGCLQKENFAKRTILQNKSRALPNGEASFNHIYKRYKDSAKNRNLEFSLNKQDFKLLIDQPCYYCGRQPFNVTTVSKSPTSYTYSGIDRVDSNFGYVLDNCVSCCKDCNFAKGQLSKEDFINLCFLVSEKHRSITNVL